MPIIEWRKEFETGIGDVDSEHAQLIDDINALVGKLGDRPSKSAAASALDEIYDKISAHFAAEERVMRERGYDQYADHKADHEILLDEIRAVSRAIDDSGAFTRGDTLVRRLSCWFTEHFKTHDRRLHKMLH
jgi:hemerythrin